MNRTFPTLIPDDPSYAFLLSFSSSLKHQPACCLQPDFCKQSVQQRNYHHQLSTLYFYFTTTKLSKIYMTIYTVNDRSIVAVYSSLTMETTYSRFFEVAEFILQKSLNFFKSEIIGVSIFFKKRNLSENLLLKSRITQIFLNMLC